MDTEIDSYMKRHLIYSILSLLVTVSALSCSSEIEKYTGRSGIYFAMSVKQTSANADTVYSEVSEIPFIITSSKDSLFNLKIKILGAVSDNDRHVSIEIVPEESDILPEDMDGIQQSYTLGAGQVFGNIPLVFHRKSSLEGKERRVTLRLVPNDDFSLPITTWKNSSAETVSVVKHTIIISDKYVQLPGYSVYYYGAFSEKKMKIILEITGKSLKEFNTRMNPTQMRAIGQALYRYLREKKAAGQTVYEEDGTEMTAGEGINK